MYNELIAALKEADSNPNVSALLMTGAGKYFSSGNDLSNSFGNDAPDADRRQIAKAKGAFL